MTDRIKIKKKRRKKGPKLPKVGGKQIKSKFELDMYNEAKALAPKGATVTYETVKLEYFVPGNYIPDIPIHFKDDRVMLIECKGYFKYTDRAKMIAVKKNNPDLDIRLVFMRNSPSCLGKGSKTRPSEWADKHGFPWAIGEIPEEWLKE